MKIMDSIEEHEDETGIFRLAGCPIKEINLHLKQSGKLDSLE